MLRLYFYLHVCLSVYAAPTTTTPSDTPKDTTAITTTAHTLGKTIPQCAFTCTEHFLQAQYPEQKCPNRSDVNCFCRSQTKSGYTLGEGVLRCMLGECEGHVLRDRASSAYNICEGVEGAIRPTHATLTVPSSVVTGMTTSTGAGTDAARTGAGTGTNAGTGTSSTTEGMARTGATKTTDTNTSPETSSTGSTGSTESSTTSASTANPKITTASSPASSDNLPFIIPSTATSTPETSPTSTNAGSDSDSNSSSLSPGSVAGVSVASGLSVFFIIALILVLWRRKQRHSEPDNHYFEIGGVMSEPPDFAFPPRRPPVPPLPAPPISDSPPVLAPLPPPKPLTPPGQITPDTTPGQTPPHTNPTVVVTGVDGHTDRIGHAISSNLDEDDHQQAAIVTAAAAGLYPEPLRWDRRPRSDITTFEEDDRPLQQPEPQPDPYPQPQRQLYPNFSGLIGPRPYPGRMATGLPAHPRAMMYGFTPQSRMQMPPPQQHEPRYQTDSDTQSESSCSGPGSGSDSESGARYYNQYAQPEPQPQPQPQHLPEHVSRHSGYFTPLPPVREARTPSRSTNTSPIDYTTSPSLRRPRVLTPGTPGTPWTGPGTPATPNHPREIVSRPRIVHQQDVKRVQIRRCKPPRQRQLEQRQQLRQPFHSRDLNAVPPYSPDDFWYDPGAYYRSSMYSTPPASGTVTASGTGSGSGSGGSGADTSYTSVGLTVASAPTPSMNRLSGSSNVEKSITRKPVRQHQLTPARRGGDLILRVDSD